MSEDNIWMVWAGQRAAFVDDFIDKKFVGIGFKVAGDVSSTVDKAALLSTMRLKKPEQKVHDGRIADRTLL